MYIFYKIIIIALLESIELRNGVRGHRIYYISYHMYIYRLCWSKQESVLARLKREQYTI